MAMELASTSAVQMKGFNMSFSVLGGSFRPCPLERGGPDPVDARITAAGCG
jgi:hypothetical protein